MTGCEPPEVQARVRPDGESRVCGLWFHAFACAAVIRTEALILIRSIPFILIARSSGPTFLAMSEHYLVIADHGHLRIFEQRLVAGQSTPGLTEVQAVDFPHGKASYTADSSDMAGRFQSSRQQGQGPGAPAVRAGMSIDERLPMQREEDRREIKDLVKQIESFFLKRPGATWDFAATPSAYNAVLRCLHPALKSRIRRSLPKDLVHQPVSELIGHFELPAISRGD